jgi:NAD(P)H-dependent FMN reductase
MRKLAVVVSSTRPGRAGLPIGRWFHERALAHGRFDVDFVDLLEVGLPFHDEPKHPRLHPDQHAHTKAWSARVARTDAFVFVTAEYNSGTPPALANALDFLHDEWAYKPVGFVSYGGVSAGTRGVQMTKQIVTTLKMMPVLEAVHIPFFAQHLDARTGTFRPPEISDEAASAMLDELLRWTEALAPLRAA